MKKNLIFINADIPLLIWGAPGTGKTAWLTHQADEFGAALYTIIGSTLEPTDVCGYPIQAGGALSWAPPDWAISARRDLDAGRPVWIFLDELSCAPASVQAALLRVVQERRVAGVDLSGCRIVAAANPVESAADGGLLAPATANRWAHVDWIVDPSTWISGEMSGWGRSLPARRLSAAAKICAYIRANPSDLLRVPDSADTAGRAWPSPRSWSAAIRAVERVDAVGWLYALTACVGAAAAGACRQYIQALDLPDPADLLAGRAKLPSRGDQLYAALLALAAYVTSGERLSDSSLLAAWHVLGTVRPDVAITAAKILLAANQDIIPPEAVDLGRRILGAGGNNDQ